MKRQTFCHLTTNNINDLVRGNLVPDLSLCCLGDKVLHFGLNHNSIELTPADCSKRCSLHLTFDKT